MIAVAAILSVVLIAVGILNLRKVKQIHAHVTEPVCQCARPTELQSDWVHCAYCGHVVR